ncbi:anti-sigma-K factor RskA [Sphingopyxis italica]|uniref:Anti-sigma-K factor RskA n=1 Tax=Sphingopyxis italica TaxID=1129133 RepID=A0A7X5XQD0_9SPHN|nr:anti-sigma factor [Sphingopyxis italica]NJB88978.1 anti-sigma-K factor RskA [Sphingopyxis italica]
MADPLTPAERDLLAAELALGLLDGQALAGALRLSLRDPAFAKLVEGWETRLLPLHAEWIDAEPAAAVWDGIAARLSRPAPSIVTAIETRLRRWRAGALVSGGIAAALAFALIFQSPPVPTAPQLAVARIESDNAGPLVLARYDRSNGVMELQIDGFESGALVPELWIIPEGGSPVSLGQVARAGRAEMTMPQPHRKLIVEGATLAVTMEPVSRIPHKSPSAPPVAAGKIITI